MKNLTGTLEIELSSPSDDCGVCDICLAKKHAVNDNELINKIRSRIQQESMTIEAVTLKFPESQKVQVLNCIRQLLDAGDIIQQEDGKLSLVHKAD